MRARAVLAQNSESNALGSVELECLPEGLLIVHLAVGAAGPGYAVGALTQGTRVLVPWGAIERIEQHPEYVFVAFDARLSPLNRMCLTHFTTFNAGDELENAKQRRIVRLGAGGLALALCISLSAQIPSWSERTSQWTAFGIGLLTALAVFVLGLAYERFYVGRAPASPHVLATFVSEMKHYRPVLQASPSAAVSEVNWAELLGLLPRSASALIILVSSAGLALVATSGWLSRGETPSERETARRASSRSVQAARAAREESSEEESNPETESATETSSVSPASQQRPAAPVSSPAAPTAAEARQSAARGEDCHCDRADSILWGPGFPRITTLLIEKSTRRHKDHQHIELELGAINNGAQSLGEVHLSVMFYEGDSTEPIRERPLYYEGPLRPGQAIKWHVSARGTRFEILNPTREVLRDRAKDFAAPNAFAELLTSANFRPVRLHAAMMLAYLGDSRSKQGALSLRDALRESEAPYLDRVLAAQNDVLSCEWRAASDGRMRAVSACIYNHGSVRANNVEIEARALDRHFDHRSPTADPPIVLAERRMPLNGALEPAQGVRVGFELDTENVDSKPPVAFEVLVDPASDR